MVVVVVMEDSGGDDDVEGDCEGDDDAGEGIWVMAKARSGTARRFPTLCEGSQSNVELNKNLIK